MKLSGYLLTLSLAFAGSALLSQENKTAQTISMKQAVDYAVQNHVSVKNAMLDEQAARHKVREVFGIGLPQVNASLDVKNFVELPTNLIPAEFFGGPPGTFIGVQFGTEWNASAGLDISQLVFDGSYIVGLQATKTFLELSEKSTERTTIDVTANVMKAYYTVLVNKERLKLLEANRQKLEKLTKDTKALFENGFAEKIDHDRATVAYNNLVVEIGKIEKMMALGTILLKYQMGMDQSTELILTDSLNPASINAAAISAEKADVAKRVEFSLLETQKRLHQLNIKKDRFGYLPNFVLYGNVNTTAQRNDFNIFKSGYRWYPMAVIGGRIGLPIFDGLQKHYRIQQSKISLMKTENDMLFLRQSIDLEVENARTIFTNNASTLGIQQKNVELADEVYRVAKLKYEQGVGSSLEVMNAETAFKEAQTNYFNALFEALVSQVDYQKATGNLTGK